MSEANIPVYTISKAKAVDKHGDRAVDEKDMFVILTVDNYVASNTHGVSTTFGRNTFARVVELFNEKFKTSVKHPTMEKRYRQKRKRFCRENSHYPERITYTKPPRGTRVRGSSSQVATVGAGHPAVDKDRLGDAIRARDKLKEFVAAGVPGAKRDLAYAERLVTDIKGDYRHLNPPVAVRNAADIQNYFSYGYESTSEEEVSVPWVIVDHSETETNPAGSVTHSD